MKYEGSTSDTANVGNADTAAASKRAPSDETRRRFVQGGAALALGGALPGCATIGATAQSESWGGGEIAHLW